MAGSDAAGVRRPRPREAEARRPPTAVVSDAGARMRVRPWRGRHDLAEITAFPVGARVTPHLVEMACHRAAELGFARAVTPALAEYEWRPFLDGQFHVREQLHLLSHRLQDLPERRRSAHRLRVVRQGDHRSVLAIDGSAFPPFWRLDAPALADALDATPSVRFRTSRDRTGYALMGRARDRGYLQRLAVAPAAQGRGLGAALVIDGLWWLRRWRVREALVNTQETNERALDLYERLGFQRHRHGLGVLEITLDPSVDVAIDSVFHP